MINSILLLIAVAAGVFLGWLIGRSKASKVIENELSTARVDLVKFEGLIAQAEIEKRRLNDLNTEQKDLIEDLRTERDKATKEGTRFEERASRVDPLEEKIKEHEKALAEDQFQIANLREELGRLTSDLKGVNIALGHAHEKIEELESNNTGLSKANTNLSIEVSDLTARLELEKSQGTEKLSLLDEAKETLSNQFKNLANEILEDKSKRFTEQNLTSLGQLLDPLKVKITDFQARVETVYDKDSKERTTLGEQVRQLMELNQSMSKDAKDLTRALKGSSKTQGNWGELVLERILEASGLRKGEEYDVQESHTRDDGSRAQPDVVIHLPEDRHLIVDAKVSLTAYEAYSSSEDEEDRKEILRRHLASVRAHMKGLSERNYQALYGLQSLDFVLMFIPIEPAFMLAVTHDHELFMDAWKKNVLLVSPSTLLFVVRTVAHLWRQESQSRNAQEIAKRGAELYDRLTGFVIDLEKVGERLKQAQESFGEARDKLSRNKGNVIRQAEMLKNLGVKPTKSLPHAVLEASLDEVSSLQTAIEDSPQSDLSTIGVIKFDPTAEGQD